VLGELGYSGKRVVVTGCASGIGRATAGILIRLGAVVHGLDCRACDLSLAAFTPIDLGDAESIRFAVSSLENPVAALFNCAGLPPTRAVHDVLKVNFLGTRLLTEFVLERMSAGGAIVSVSSNGGMAWRDRLPLLLDWTTSDGFAAGERWVEQHAGSVGHAYRFSKEALIVWTMACSATLIQRGIRINTTSPGAVQTPMLDEIAAHVPAAAIDATIRPIGRRSSAEEQAWPLVLLNSDLVSYVTGVDLPVDGGFAALRGAAAA
jgi:NAD(P)-dependent dehydrogenase (short-subunit alcohol dehydrogenase family)